MADERFTGETKSGGTDSVLPSSLAGMSEIVPEGQIAVNRLAAPLTLSQKGWVQNVLPWVTSAVLHMGIILAAILLYRTAERVVQAVREQIIIPDAVMLDTGPVGGVPNPGLGSDPNRVAAQDQVTDAAPGQVRPAGQRLNQAVSGGTEGAGDTVIGIGGGGTFSRGKGVGTGSGDAGGDRAGGLFGIPGGGSSSGPPASFVGVRSNATRIVYLCDVSGTMIGQYKALKSQVESSVTNLRIPQAFSIVFFAEQTRALSDTTLFLASPDNKRKAFAFVDNVFRGNGLGGPTLPAPAIRRAFALNPQVIFVLTDGFEFADTNEVLRLFQELNKEKKVRVNTIRVANLDEEATKPQVKEFSRPLVELLQKIAGDSGGIYREVNRNDF